MKKNELNHNIHLSEGNIKSKNTDEVLFLTWSLPSRECCPYSTELCRKNALLKRMRHLKQLEIVDTEI